MSVNLTTERLLLRPYEPDDLTDFYAMVSDPEVVRFEPYDAMSLREAEACLRERMTEDFTAVVRREDGRMIGNVYLAHRSFESMELGYVFARAAWGHGYATEACGAAVEAAFARGVHRVFAECNPENAASWRLLERLGFRREGLLRQNVFFRRDGDGRPVWQDTCVYARLWEDGR